MRKIDLTLLLVFLCVNSIHGQIQTAKGKEFIPVSPSAGSLGTFGIIPVGLYTGIPEIGVPLYNIEYKELSVPIGLQYHAEGNRPDVVPGPVGLSWTLFSGGSITRIVNGYPDEGGYNSPDGQPIQLVYPTMTDDWASDTKMNRYLTFNQSTIDDSGDPDAYFFNFNGMSGKFIPRYIDGEFGPTAEYRAITNQGTLLKISIEKASNKTFVVKNLQQEPTDLYLCSYSNSFKLNKLVYRIKIKDGRGVEYIFGGQDNAIEFSRPGFSTLESPSERYIVPTTWHLTSITSPNGYTIDFTYDRGMPIVTKTSYTDIPKCTWKTKPINYPPIAKGEKSTLINTSQLKQITTPFQTVTFYNSTASNQLWFPFVEPSPLPWMGSENDFHSYKDVCEANTQKLFGYKVDSILVKNEFDKKIVRRIRFGYTGDVTTRLKLMNVQIANGSGTGSPQVYSFVYNSTPLPEYLSFKTDSYGFYNGRNEFMISNNPNDYLNISPLLYNASKEPVESFAKAEILERIYYPTGGYTVFEYELNKYQTEAKTWPFVVTTNSSASTTGGLRIKEITSYESQNKMAFRKRYYYKKDYRQNGDISSGVLSYKPVFIEQYSGTVTPPANTPDPNYYNGTLSYWRFKSDPIYPMSNSAKNHVTYSEVAEVNEDNTFKIYKFKNYDNGYHDQQPINYACDNTDLKAFYKEDEGTSLDLERGLLLSEEYFNSNKNLVAKTIYKYNDGSSDRDYKSLKIISRSINSVNIIDHFPSLRYVAKLAYTYFPYVKEKIDTIYNSDGSSIGKVIKSKYRQEDKFLTEEITYTSKNEEMKVANKNPNDMVAQGITDPYQSMVLRNILPIVEKEVTQNGNPVSKVLTNYSSKSFSVFVPVSEESAIGDSALEERVLYHDFDANGNPLTMSNKDDIFQSFIWGYNNVYPIARVINAKRDEIFADNFEDKVGWDSNLSFDNTRSHTGLFSGKIANVTSGKISSLNTDWVTISLLNTTRFKYSGWVYSNGPGVDINLYMSSATETNAYTIIDNVSTSTSGKWILLEKEFDVPANITRLKLRVDNNGSGNVWFDDLRLHPAEAEMTTYTYNPLFGLTSKSDTNNITSYYEYDEFGRLIYLKDDDYNIIKKYEYNYKLR